MESPSKPLAKQLGLTPGFWSNHVPGDGGRVVPEKGPGGWREPCLLSIHLCQTQRSHLQNVGVGLKAMLSRFRIF